MSKPFSETPGGILVPGPKSPTDSSVVKAAPKTEKELKQSLEKLENEKTQIQKSLEELQKLEKEKSDKKFKDLLHPRKPSYTEPTNHVKDISTNFFKLFIGLPFFCFFGVFLLFVKATGVAAEVAVDSLMDAKVAGKSDYVFWPDLPKEERDAMKKKFKEFDIIKIFHPLAVAFDGEIEEKNMTLTNYVEKGAYNLVFKTRHDLATDTVDLSYDTLGINRESAKKMDDEAANAIKSPSKQPTKTSGSTGSPTSNKTAIRV